MKTTTSLKRTSHGFERQNAFNYEIDKNNLYSSVPETITPTFKNFLESIVRDASVFSSKISIPDAIMELNKISTTIKQIIGKTVETIKATGEQIINDTQNRRKLEEQKAAQKIIDDAIKHLNAVGEAKDEITLNAVLEMVQKETLAELVLDDILPGSVKEIPSLLVRPIIDIVCHYDAYFDYAKLEGSDSAIKHTLINTAFTEFRNKQKIRDMVHQLYGQRTDITLNDVIDDLFKLYNTNFKTNYDSSKKLSVNGRVRVLKYLYTKQPDVKISEIIDEKTTEKKAFVSAIDYDGIWAKHAKDIKFVDESLVRFREANQAEMITGPLSVGIPSGYANRYTPTSADAGSAIFAPPLVPASDNLMETEGEIIDSQVSDFSGEYANVEEEVETMDVGEEDDTITLEEESNMNAELKDTQKLKNEQKQARHIVDEPYDVDKSTREALQQLGQIPSKLPQIGEIALRKNKIAEHFEDKIIMFADTFHGDYIPEQLKQKWWEHGVHKILLEWYNEYELLEREREELENNVLTKESTDVFGTGLFKSIGSMFGNSTDKNNIKKRGKRGGKKSHKNHKKHHKKQTRKNSKHSTHKLYKNYKKHSNHTKKH
jgi:hypothetical protein